VKWSLAVALLCVASTARAYPHYQLRDGEARCSGCHWAPAGGGPASAWGRHQAAGPLSASSWLWPSGERSDDEPGVSLGWLDLAVATRLALLRNQISGPTGAEWHLIPMQADTWAHAERGSFSAVAGLGLNGATRLEDQRVTSYFVSREHWVAWQPDAEGGLYARAGRFMAPFGLRLADHTTYVRRYTGHDLLQESYGASGGWLGDAFEVHATASLYNPYAAAGRDERGGTLYGEARLGPSAIGASLRVGDSPRSRRYTGGVNAKLRLDGLATTLLAELDATSATFPRAGDESREEIAAYGGFVAELKPGLNASLAYELWAPDVEVKGLTRHAVSAWVTLLPRGSWEVQLSGRWQLIGRDEDALAAMLMGYFWL
jgi:hypothetical protein